MTEAATNSTATTASRLQHFLEEWKLKAFLAEWQPKALSLNWQQLWLDSETGEVVDFAQIQDAAELKEKSDRAEGQYLAQVDRCRRDYVFRFPEPVQQEQLRQFERELCKSDLYYLSKYVLGYDQQVFHLHYFMCQTMENLAEGYRGLREFPRDTFKTTTMGISYIIQQVLNDPDVRILYKSNAEGNASNKVVEAKNHFIKNAKLIELFPEHKPRRKTDEGSDTEWTTPARRAVQAEATFTAAGVGSSKTSQHYAVILGDDFWDEKSVTSPEVMSKARRELNQLEYLLAVPSRGRIVFIGTRFAHDDLTKDLVDNPFYHCVIASGITPAGRSLFPENMGIGHLFSQAHASKYDFSCQIILNPTDDTRGFQREWFKYLSYAELRALELEGRIETRKVILADATAEGKAKSDYVAIHVIVIDSLGRFTVVEYIREKLAPSEFIDTVFQLYDKWLPEYVVRQKTLLETTIMSFVHQRNKERSDSGKRMVPFYDYSLKKREKKGRITASLQPLLQAGKIWFDRDLAHLQELEKELLEHPNSQNDDGIDALSMLDDPAIARIPHYSALVPPLPDGFVPDRDTAASAEQSYRKHQAQSLFKSIREEGKKKDRARPGSVVD